MEFKPIQIEKINAIMPFKYKIEPFSKKESKISKSTNSKSETERLKPKKNTKPKIPEKQLVPILPLKKDVKSTTKPNLSGSNKNLHKILQELKNREFSFFWDFVTKNKFPEYNLKFADPLDFSIIESRVLSDSYETKDQFSSDIRRMLSNSFSYFAGSTDIYTSLIKLSSCIEDLINGTQAKEVRPPQISTFAEPISKPQLSKIEKEIKLQDKPLGYFEQKQLCDSIKRLDPKYLKGVLEIVKECTDMKGEELEFDINKLPTKVCRELDKYVKKCMGIGNKFKKEEVKLEVIVPKPEPVVEIAEQAEERLPQGNEIESSSTSESEEFSAGYFELNGGDEDFDFFEDISR